MNIRKTTKESEFQHSRRLKFEEAKPTSKQRLCIHRCGADGSKVQDARGVENRFFSCFRYKWLLLLLLFTAASCQRHFVSVTQQKIDVNYLASMAVRSPDPRQAHPPIGQQLVVDWQVPQALLKRNPICILHVIYWDYTEETFTHKIDRKIGHWTYDLLNEAFFARKGILTYRAEILTSDGEVYKEWKHQLWVNLIQQV